MCYKYRKGIQHFFGVLGLAQCIRSITLFLLLFVSVLSLQEFGGSLSDTSLVAANQSPVL